ncbi:helix-turn-helix transcriptional regulator [Microbacterium sp. NPDC058389]|uniref:helix-turn-helix transcriptional regulator n=1 Tax=Microbacterium sp. NPDC058389 TaxID=3346475 RepID=UPI003652BF2D
MSTTAVRLLGLLSLMQARPTWTGPALAERLGVSGRTIRTDIDRLRELGYPVATERGVHGGYRLEAGARMPPLLLDDDEAIAIAISLSALAPQLVAGVDESASRALAKLDQVIPSRLRQQVAALRHATETPQAPARARGHETPVAPDVLAGLATAIQESEWCRFGYAKATLGDVPGTAEKRHVEPYRLVAWNSRWYLVAYDLDRDDWRTFRADRMQLGPRTFRRFAAREMPTDASTLVLRGVAGAGWRAHARVIVQAPAAEVLTRIDATVGTVELLDESTSALVTGADSLERIAAYLGMLGLGFTVDEPAELRSHLRALGERYLAAADPGDDGPRAASE